MRGRGFIAAACIVVCASSAWAIDDRVLGRDDVEFAEALSENDFVDLAERLLPLIEARGDSTTSAAYREVRLDVEKAAACKIDDPILRRDALTAVLYRSERFVDDFRDAPEAVRVGDAVADVCFELGETIAAAIRRTNAESTAEALRTEGDSVLERTEQWIAWRIEPLQARESQLDEDESARLVAQRFGGAMTLYAHALLFESGSAKRLDLDARALAGFETYDVADSVSSPELIRDYYACLYAGLCLSELGKTKESVESFDKVIALRRSWGDADEKTGVYPVPSDARDVVDLIGYAVREKVRTLIEAGKTTDAIAAGKDYFATMPRPFESSISMVLAKTLGEEQIAGGDANGGNETARRMIGEDPDGVGGQWGRELIDRGAK